MATTIALLIALVAYTATVVVVNTLGPEATGAYNFDIYGALNTIATHPVVTDIIPASAEPLHMVVAAIGLIIPSIISFWIVCFIIK